MMYIPVCMVGMLLILWILKVDGMMDDYGSRAKLLSSYGDEYKLLAIMYIGGRECDIDLNILGSARGELPELLEIRYEKDRYWIRNLEEECKVVIHDNMESFTLGEDEERTLREDDTFEVIYQNISMKYTFKWG